MRVLIGAECFLPAVNGVTNSIVRAIDHLTMRGHEVTVIAPGPGPATHRAANGTYVSVERMPSIRPSLYPTLTVGMASSRSVERIVDGIEPDIVHLAAPTMLAATIGRVAARRGIPTVALFQTDLAGFAADYRLRFAGRAIWSWLRRIHNGAELTLAPTPGIARKLRSHGIARVAVWGRGVDHTQFNPTHRCDAVRAEFGLTAPGDTPRVLVGYVGRVAAEKQIGRLAPLSQDPRLQLVIVGDGPAAPSLRRLMPAAHFAGFRSGAALGAAVASLDVFVHTGPNETYCQALQEAMACGVAVVAPSAGGPADLVDHDRTGLLYDPDIPGALEVEVARVVADPALRLRLGTAACEEVAGRSWEALGDQLIAHYHRAMELLEPIPLRARSVDRGAA